jgi:hypothetical protein
LLSFFSLLSFGADISNKPGAAVSRHASSEVKLAQTA